MTQRVSSKEAAAELGCCVPYMHEQMRTGHWDLGNAIKPNRGKKNWSYHIYRPKLDAHMGAYREEVQKSINGELD